MNSMVKGISVALVLGERERLTPEEIKEFSKMFGVGIRQVYRYVEQVHEARFYMKDVLKEKQLTWSDVKHLDTIVMVMKSNPEYAIHLLGDGKAFYEEALDRFKKSKGWYGKKN